MANKTEDGVQERVSEAICGSRGPCRDERVKYAS